MWLRHKMLTKFSILSSMMLSYVKEKDCREAINVENMHCLILINKTNIMNICNYIV